MPLPMTRSFPVSFCSLLLPGLLLVCAPESTFAGSPPLLRELTTSRPALIAPGTPRLADPVLPSLPVVNPAGAGLRGLSSSTPASVTRAPVQAASEKNPLGLAGTGQVTLSVQESTQVTSPGVVSAPGSLILARTSATPEEAGSLEIAWAADAAFIKVPGGVYQVALEKKTEAGLWQPVKVRHFAGEGGEFVVPFPTLPQNLEDYRARGYTVNKFNTLKTTPASTQLSPAAEVTASVAGVSALSAGRGITIDNPATMIAKLMPTLTIPTLVKVGNGTLELRDISTGISLTGGMLVMDSATGRSESLTTLNTAVGTTATTLAGTGALATTSNLTATTGVTLGASVDSNMAAPVAVESDIWKFAGNRLFYFNQFRGLQVFNVADPARPVKVGTLRMPAVGDQIQVLDPEGRHVALLTRRSVDGWKSQIKLVAISEAGTPTVVATVPLDGYLGETRLIGSRLYAVVTGSWRNGSQYATVRLQGYDLSDPANPVDLGHADGTGYTPVLQDAGTHLLVATNGGARTVIHAVDISGDGRPRLVKAVALKGTLRDQFKMSIVSGALVGVSAIERKWVWGPAEVVTDGDKTTVTQTYTIYPSQTWVETFSLTDDGNEPLASINLEDAEGETLYATRFDGKRLYVVTYGVKQKGPKTFSSIYTYFTRPPCDPLFIVDLDDPAHPVVRGQLEIPGYSTFIEPMGDRLLSVGTEDNRIAASLFDVSDPDAPSLLSRVFPGASNGSVYWSNSEALTEHRAVTWLPAQNKFIVPVQGWTSNGYRTVTQEITFDRTKLKLGDLVETEETARRGTAIGGFLLTISGRELVVAKDSDGSGKAKQVAWLELAWPVDQVVTMGDYVIEIESRQIPQKYGWGWYWPAYYLSDGSCRRHQTTVLRLASRRDPENIIDSVELPGEQASIVGTSVRGGRLYLAQWAGVSADDKKAELRTYVVRPLANRLQQLGSVTTTVSLEQVEKTSSINLSAVQGLWVQDDKLVWYVPCAQRVNDYLWRWGSGWYWNCCCWVPDGTTPEEVARRQREAEGWGMAVSALIAPITVTTTGNTSTYEGLEEPLSIVAAPNEVMLMGSSRAFTDNGRLFFSSSQNTEIDSLEKDEEMVAKGDFVTSTYSATIMKTVLHVLDFNAPVVPDELGFTEIPGPLLGASSADEQGAWLMCVAQPYGSSYGYGVLSLAYDGHLVRRKDKVQVFADTASSDSRNGSLYLVDYGVQTYRQNQRTGRIEKLALWQPKGFYQYISRVIINGQRLLAAGYQSLSVARIQSNHTLTTLGSKSWSGYSTQVNAWAAALDPRGDGAWVPATEYGVEWMAFDKADPTLATSGEE